MISARLMHEGKNHAKKDKSAYSDKTVSPGMV